MTDSILIRMAMRKAPTCTGVASPSMSAFITRFASSQVRSLAARGPLQIFAIHSCIDITRPCVTRTQSW